MPGIIMVMAMVMVAIYYASKNKIKRERFVFKEAVAAIKNSFWEMLLPVIIMLGYFGGITTLVESAAVAVLYALVVEVLIHRDIKFRDFAGSPAQVHADHWRRSGHPGPGQRAFLLYRGCRDPHAADRLGAECHPFQVRFSFAVEYLPC